MLKQYDVTVTRTGGVIVKTNYKKSRGKTEKV